MAINIWDQSSGQWRADQYAAAVDIRSRAQRYERAYDPQVDLGLRVADEEQTGYVMQAHSLFYDNTTPPGRIFPYDSAKWGYYPGLPLIVGEQVIAADRPILGTDRYTKEAMVKRIVLPGTALPISGKIDRSSENWKRYQYIAGLAFRSLINQQREAVKREDDEEYERLRVHLDSIAMAYDLSTHSSIIHGVLFAFDSTAWIEDSDESYDRLTDGQPAIAVEIPVYGGGTITGKITGQRGYAVLPGVARPASIS
jgi:hypothetical protein